MLTSLATGCWPLFGELPGEKKKSSRKGWKREVLQTRQKKLEDGGKPKR